MAGNKWLTLLEPVDRKVRATTTGMEIHTTFYVEPASAAPLVVCALLGGVTANTSAGLRIYPAHDHEYPFCYCTEAHPSPMDRRSASGAPSILPLGWPNGDTTLQQLQAALDKPIIFDGRQTLKSDGSGYDPTAISTKRNLCGEYIEAVYRPLSTVFNGLGTGAVTGAFDYIDPQFYPCSRSLPGPPGSLYARYAVDHAVGARVNYAVDAAANLGVETWNEFTIRRVMCPSVPWETIRQLQTRINGLQAWTPASMTIPGLLNNKFPKGTLRFDSAEPIKRVIPSCFDSNGNLLGTKDNLPITQPSQWWDILYKFSWRAIYDYWYTVDVTGDPLFPPLVTNGPDWISWDFVFTGPFGSLGGYSPVGWYDCKYDDRSILIPGGNERGRPMYLWAEDPNLSIANGGNNYFGGATHPFDTLFLLGAP